MTEHTWKINILLIILIMVGLISCTSDESAQSSKKAEIISREEIGFFQATQTVSVATMQSLLTSKEPTPIPTSYTDTGQAITIKGYDLYNIDPLVATGTDQMIAYVTMIGLTRVDSETGETGSGLAESWEISEDGLTWTFHLKDDIPWVRYNPETGKVEHVKTGGQVRKVQADDIVYGINRILDPANKSTNASLLINLIAEQAEDATGVHQYAIKSLDAKTLEIKLVEPVSYFDALAELPIMSSQPEWLIIKNGDDWMGTGVFQGYGPYIIKEWDDDEYLTLIKNPYWVGTESIPEARINTISLVLSSSGDPLLDFSNNRTDFVLLSSNDIDGAKQNEAINQYMESNIHSCVRVLGFNTNLSPVDSPRLRQALAMSIDQQAILNLYDSDYQPAQCLMMPGSRGAPAVNEIADMGIQYDLEAARKMLDKFYVSPADVPEIEIVVPSTSSSKKLANEIRRMWMDNLDLQVKVSDYSSVKFSEMLGSDTPPMVWLNSFCLDYNDAGNLFYYELFRNSVRASSRGWQNMALLSITDQILKENEIEKRTELYIELEENIKSENVYLVPLFWFSSTHLVQPHLVYSLPVVDGLVQFEKWYVEK
ncbi:MAG: hypothetical protein JXR32_08435 [Anaerolineaceae bacterium]|nr:hypothetical protein [Anaerolineaceae bacterium]